ncbi:hypothetical protein EMQ_0403 [Acetobacter aceti NBRC 14818]|uniref:Uncharacterized protein n=1 Tax=Acetobacter aceti NBRC 14818 TaxID=887700 RepID=A0AB33I912_ACEAC|nr:hypothetical protein EMQ_0403 [Acetobacter aceti NBRC 14818]GAN58092.1 hypothetical protein Abac_030_071 [Acetobacter aceti NBRC 14818]
MLPCTAQSVRTTPTTMITAMMITRITTIQRMLTIITGAIAAGMIMDTTTMIITTMITVFSATIIMRRIRSVGFSPSVWCSTAPIW